MKRFTMKMALAAVISALAAPGYAAQAVTVTNTPLPVTAPSALPVTVNNPSTAPVPVQVINDPTRGGSNVTVTNTATNPVKVDAALQRTPIDVQLDIPDCTTPPNCLPLSVRYFVPNDQYLVIETISVNVRCIGTEAPRLRINGNRDIVLPTLVSSGNVNPGALYSVRIELPPGTFLEADEGELNCSSFHGVQVDLWGYLVGSSAHSLAP